MALYIDHLVGGGDPIYVAVLSLDCCWGLDRWPDWRLTLPDIMPGLGLLSGELVKEDTCAKIFGQYTKKNC